MCYITLIKPEAKRETTLQLNKKYIIYFKVILDSYYAISLVAYSIKR